jgi:tRNA threonylcarbamoyladenosine biosynthesis protein TsaE
MNEYDVTFVLEDIDIVSKNLTNKYSNTKLWYFMGDIGVGKTTLIQSICKTLGICDIVTSPTYSIINMYTLPSKEKVAHMDCYRLNEQDIDNIDINYYIAISKYCFIEWANILINKWNAVIINITKNSDCLKRSITCYER